MLGSGHNCGASDGSSKFTAIGAKNFPPANYCRMLVPKNGPAKLTASLRLL
jgi:hypothetical protein